MGSAKSSNERLKHWAAETTAPRVNDTMAVKDRASNSIKVSRYMSFTRFVWMLKKKALWMSRVDQLGDAWEMASSKEELELIAEAASVPDPGLGAPPRFTDSPLAIEFLNSTTVVWLANSGKQPLPLAIK